MNQIPPSCNALHLQPYLAPDHERPKIGTGNLWTICYISLIHFFFTPACLRFRNNNSHFKKVSFSSGSFGSGSVVEIVNDHFLPYFEITFGLTYSLQILAPHEDCCMQNIFCIYYAIAIGQKRSWKHNNSSTSSKWLA